MNGLQGEAYLDKKAPDFALDDLGAPTRRNVRTSIRLKCYTVRHCLRSRQILVQITMIAILHYKIEFFAAGDEIINVTADVSVGNSTHILLFL